MREKKCIPDWSRLFHEGFWSPYIYTEYLKEILASSLWTELSAFLIVKCNHC